MNQYLLFAGSKYYPRGGFLDFVGDFGVVNSALIAAANLDGGDCDWWQIVDRSTLKILYSGERN